MSIIGDALFEETEADESVEALLVRVAELRAENRYLTEECEMYRATANQYRRRHRRMERRPAWSSLT